MTYLKFWPLQIPIGFLLDTLGLNKNSGYKIINLTKWADFIKDVHSQNKITKNNNVSSTGLLTTQSGWPSLRPRPPSSTCYSVQLERGPGCRCRGTQVESVESADVKWNWTELAKTRQNALVNNLKGADSPKGHSVLNLIAMKIQSEMGGDTDDLISWQNVTVLLGKISIVYPNS